MIDLNRHEFGTSKTAKTIDLDECDPDWTELSTIISVRQSILILEDTLLNNMKKAKDTSSMRKLCNSLQHIAHTASALERAIRMLEYAKEDEA